MPKISCVRERYLTLEISLWNKDIQRSARWEKQKAGKDILLPGQNLQVELDTFWQIRVLMHLWIILTWHGNDWMTFYGCWCSAAELDHFNWALLSLNSRRKSLFSLSCESYCQSQYNWDRSIWIGDKIYVNIVQMYCFDGKCSLLHARGLKVFALTVCVFFFFFFLESLVNVSGTFTS